MDAGSVYKIPSNRALASGKTKSMKIMSRFVYGWRMAALVVTMLAPLAAAAFVVGGEHAEVAKKTEVSAIEARVAHSEDQITGMLEQLRQLREEQRKSSDRMLDYLVGISDQVGAARPRRR